jgi:hypothetical protein
MANYLLLRNNKESGPYSLDNLMELGLKPYDLIWVQGRSAAWRYPSEVEELKPIAAAIEEQPFDRFYKKTETFVEEIKNQTFFNKKKIAAPIPVSPIVTETKYEKPVADPPYQKPVVEPIFEKPVAEPQYEKYIPKRSVVVTMPGQKDIVAKQPAKEEVQVQPTITISENPAAAQIKYSQPLDEIKEMYVKTLHDRKQKIARKTFWLQSMKKGAVVMSLVAVGVIAGFIIKPNKSKQAGITAGVEKPSQSLVPKTEPAINTPDTTVSSNSTASVTEPLHLLHQPAGGYVNKVPETESKPAELKQSPEKPINDNVKKEVATTTAENKLNTASLLPEGVETDPATGERNRKVRSGNTETGSNNNSSERKSSLPADVSNLVSVKSNEYKRVAFGGIRDLQLTVTNDSKYILDNVTVEVQYIKPNELPLKTESIQFTSIAPNATSTIRVPDTNRGIKVIFRITNIKKRQGDERVADN